MEKLRSYMPLLLALLLPLAAVLIYGVVNSQSANGKYDTDGDGLIEIEYLEQLSAIRYDPNGDGDSGFSEYYQAFPLSQGESVCANPCNGYELTRSLDFSDQKSYASGRVKTEWITGSGWQSIGRSEELRSGFGATFEGNYHTIRSLYINRKREEYRNYSDGSAGLFSSTGNSSIIRRVGMLSVDITAEAPAGGLTGQNAGLIENCYVTGNITTKTRIDHDNNGLSTYAAGGLAGHNSGTVRYSHASATVLGDANVGGLVGYNIDPNGLIVASYASGRVSDRDADGEFREWARAVGNSIGGLVGENNGTVSGSYATASVSGDNQVGGLVGFSFYDGIIADSFATGKVRGHSAVGGLVGNNYGKITNSYSIGSVYGDSGSGGLVGSSAGSESAQVYSSYWDTQKSQLEGSRAGEGYGMGKTTSELQDPRSNTGIYHQWNPNRWDFGTSRQYPALKFDVDGDGVAFWWEIGPQTGERPTPTPTPTATPTPTPIVRATADVFKELVDEGFLVVVWHYDNATASWSVYDPTLPAELNDLTHVSPKDIVWLEVTAEAQFQDRTLSKGWNLIALK